MAYIFMVSLALIAQSRPITSDAVMNFVPIALFLVILYFLFRRQIKATKGQVNDAERRQQHMQRVEDLLERIANALDRRQ